MKVKFKTKEVDIAQGLPLTLGDLKKLKALGVDLMTLQREEVPDVERITVLVLYVCQKVDPSTTMEDVDSLTLADIAAFNQLSLEKKEEADRPT